MSAEMFALMNQYILNSQNLVDRFRAAETSFQARQTQERQEFETLGQEYRDIIQSNAAEVMSCARQIDLLVIEVTIDNCLNRLSDVAKNMEDLASGVSDESDE